MHFERNPLFLNRIIQPFVTGNQFMKVLKSMKGSYQRLAKILQKNIRDIYTPTTIVTVDETILAFTGKSSLKVYIMAKPHPNGIKLYTLVDKDGVLCAFIIYEKTKISIYEIFSQLLGKFVDKDHKVYADRWFGSSDAVLYCKENGLKFLFNMSMARGKKMWTSMKSTTDKVNYTVKWHNEYNDVQAIQVKINDTFMNFITNHIDLSVVRMNDAKGSKINWNKQVSLAIVKDYNKNMGLVDCFNRDYYAYLPTIRQQSHVDGIRRALLRFAVVNSFHMYQLYHKLWDSSFNALSQLEFLDQLSGELLGFSMEGWREYRLHFFTPMKGNPKCKGCTPKNKASRCGYQCSYFAMPLCRKCFKRFHMK